MGEVAQMGERPLFFSFFTYRVINIGKKYWKLHFFYIFALRIIRVPITRLFDKINLKIR